jgi:vacuolar protein sorting-associated protein 13A/C
VAGFGWSDSISITNFNLYYFMLKNINALSGVSAENFRVEQYITLSLQVTPDNDSYLLTVREEPEMGSFKFVNNLNDMMIFLSQDPEKLRVNVTELSIQPQTWKYYSWPTSINNKRSLYMRVLRLSTKQITDIIEVDFEKPSYSYNVLGTRFYHNRERSGGTMVFKFSFIFDQKEKMKQLRKTTINVPYLGLSIIGGKRENRRELLFMSITEMKVTLEAFDKISKTRLKIGYFNIDNNHEYISYYPMVLSPKYSYESMKRHGLNHIDVYIKQLNKEQTHPKGSTVINMIDVKIIGNLIKIEESFIHFALAALDEMVQESKISNDFILKGQMRSIDIDPNQHLDYKIDLAAKALQNYKMVPADSRQPSQLYINELAICEHDITFSLKRERGDDPKAALNRYSAYLKSYGFDYMISLEDVEINFKKFILPNDLYPIQILQKEVINQYKNNAIESALASMLDLNILGNPRKIGREIRTGFEDLVNKPADRLDQNNSVANLSKGVVEGTGSLARHTAMGTLGGVSTITGTVGNLTSGLTMDKRYMFERQKLKSAQVNKDMGTMTLGLKQLGFSLKDSVTGIFTKPVELTEKEGILGAIKGSFIGISGLITKPITGLFDFASTLTGGARKAMDKTNLTPSTVRVRNPRAFYGTNSYIK